MFEGSLFIPDRPSVGSGAPLKIQVMGWRTNDKELPAAKNVGTIGKAPHLQLRDSEFLVPL